MILSEQARELVVRPQRFTGAVGARVVEVHGVDAHGVRVLDVGFFLAVEVRGVRAELGAARRTHEALRAEREAGRGLDSLRDGTGGIGSRVDADDLPGLIHAYLVAGRGVVLRRAAGRER